MRASDRIIAPPDRPDGAARLTVASQCGAPARMTAAGRARRFGRSASLGRVAVRRRASVPVRDRGCYDRPVNRRELWRRLAQRPNAVRFAEMRQLLELAGWTLERVKGSHHVFGRDGEQLVVPYRRPHVLAAYVREALRRTKEEGDD